MRVIRSGTAGRRRRDTESLPARDELKTKGNLLYLFILDLTESFNPVSPLQKDLVP